MSSTQIDFLSLFKSFERKLKFTGRFNSRKDYKEYSPLRNFFKFPMRNQSAIEFNKFEDLKLLIRNNQKLSVTSQLQNEKITGYEYLRSCNLRNWAWYLKERLPNVSVLYRHKHKNVNVRKKLNGLKGKICYIFEHTEKHTEIW